MKDPIRDWPEQSFVLPPLELLSRYSGLSVEEVEEIAREAWVNLGGRPDVSIVWSERVPETEKP